MSFPIGYQSGGSSRDLMRELRAHLAAHPGESTSDRLASELRCSRAAMTALLRRLQAAGVVSYDRDSGYWQHRHVIV
jgi:Mn-dependent DtxR family transcriptional regulator